MKGSSRCGAEEMNPPSIHEDAGSIPGLNQWISNLVLLWLWCRPVAAAPVWPLVSEIPYATGVAVKKKKRSYKGILYNMRNRANILFYIVNILLCFIYIFGYASSRWKFPGQGSNWSCSSWPTPKPQQHQIWTVCYLHHSSWQYQIPNSPREARDWTCVLMDASQVCFRWAMTGTPA